MRNSLIFILILTFLTVKLNAQFHVSGSTGADGDYTSLTAIGGVFAKINASMQTGNTIVITVSGNSAGEPGYSTLNQKDWNSLVIYPTTPGGYTISGAANKPLIYFTGADNVTIDGSVDGTGSTNSLTIINTSTGTGAATIAFTNSSENNKIRYCNIQGSGTSTSKGIILFTTSSSGNGNIQNLIEYNNITKSSSGRPVNAIYSVGSVGHENSAITISNNNIYDFLNPGLTSTGIYFGAYTSSCSIESNSFYETTTFTPTVAIPYYVIRINNTLGGNFTVTGNFIGGKTIQCGGTAWTKSGNNTDFTAISLNTGTTSESNIENNTIRNIAWSNTGTASWTGIAVTGGNVNIGTNGGNILGSSTGTGSIILTAGLTDARLYGINLGSTGSIDCSNNIIGSITTSNTSGSSSTNIYCINNSAAGTVILSANSIGSTTDAGSIRAGSTATGNAQLVYGINNTANSTLTISDNTIANMVNGTINALGSAGLICGINSTNGTLTVERNIIQYLTNANNNTSSSNTASVTGIALTGALQKTVTGNSISYLSNTFTSFTGNVTGIYFGGIGGSSPVNDVSQNFIFNLSVSQFSSGANLNGIRIANGSTTYYNNIIALCGNTASTINGIYEAGFTGTINTFDFNTVFIGGSPSSGSYSSHAFYNNNATLNPRNIWNNIFMNARSNSGATGKHYAIRLAGTSGLTIDYNDYFASGSGGILGFLTVDKTTLALWQSATSQDGGSLSKDPYFLNPCGQTPADYQLGASLPGLTGTGTATDFGGADRGTPPTMGAWEGSLNQWKGTSSSVWGLAANWTGGVVPANDENIYFDLNPLRPLVMDQDRSVGSISNNQSVNRLVTNGFKLTILGDLNFSNGAQIDASATNSTVEFAGTVIQSIPAGAFYNDKIYDLIINNGNNVILNGTVNLLNNITSQAGVLDAMAPSSNVTYGGNNLQYIQQGIFLNDRVYDLTVDNGAGLTLNTEFAVDNTLRVNTIGIFVIDPPGKATIKNILNYGAIVLNSTSPSDIYSLMMDSYSGSGVANVQLFLTGGGYSRNYNWHLVAVPADGLSTNYFTDINSKNLMGYNDSRVVTSDNNGWSYYDGYGGTPGIPAGGEFSTLLFGRGYNFWSAADVTVNFTAMPSLGTTLGNVSLQYSGSTPDNPIYGLNLLGNSLTCSIDWDKAVLSGPVSSTVTYVIAQKISTYNALAGGTNGATKDIPPLQGFFVQATATGASIDFTDAREHSTQSRYKKSGAGVNSPKEENTPPKVKLELSGTDGTSDETIVWFNEDATRGYDIKYDGYKLFSSEKRLGQLYSILDGKNYVINGIPLPDNDFIVPLGIKISKSGDYSLVKKDFVSPDGYDIQLIDKAKNNLAVNLKKTSQYSFHSKAGTFTDRFYLKISSLSPGARYNELPDKQFNIYVSDGMINILPLSSTEDFSEGEVKVFDLMGRVVKQVPNIEWNAGTLVQIPLNDKHGIFMVEVTSGIMRQVGKVILK